MEVSGGSQREREGELVVVHIARHVVKTEIDDFDGDEKLHTAVKLFVRCGSLVGQIKKM